MKIGMRDIDSSPPVLFPPMALLTGMVAINVGASFAQKLFPIVGAEGATSLRLTIGALILFFVLRPWRMRILSGTWLPLIVYGVMMGAMNLLFYMSLKTLPLGVAVAIEFMGPLAVATLTSRRWIDFVWIIIAVAGLILLLPLSEASSDIDTVGVLYALGAGACWALYIVFGRVAGRDHGTTITSIGMIIAALTVLPFGIAHAGMALIDPTVLTIGVLIAVLSSALPYTLEMFALRHLPTNTYGTLTCSEPAIGALVGLVLLGQVLPLIQWGGILLISLASVGTTVTVVRSKSSR